MKVISASEAASLIQPGDSVLVSGSGGGHCVPEAILDAVEARFLETGAPRDLCQIHAVGIGDRKLKGAARFRHPGMLKRSITGTTMWFETMIDNAIDSRMIIDVAEEKPPMKANRASPSWPAASGSVSVNISGLEPAGMVVRP